MNNATLCNMPVMVFAFASALTITAAAQQNQIQPMQQAAPAQAQTAAAASPNSFCGNRPLCYDANDFAVTVTEFRTSTDGRGTKILDAMLHFINKTNQPISLGYVDQSGGVIDDMGNRFQLNTYGGGVRGMGVVSGNNMDPKFTLPAGGAGDARLEFWWPPYGKLAGVNYQMEFSIREMNRVEGNQWTLGDEALIHYQGLANGMGVAPVGGGNSFAAGSGAGGPGGTVSSVGSAVGGFVPGQATNAGPAPQTIYVAAGQPCPPGTSSQATNIANAVGQQNQAANNAISTATSAVASLGSIFGKKKTPTANANNATNATGTTPCVATTNTMTNAATNPAVTRTATPALPTNTANMSAARSRAANGNNSVSTQPTGGSTAATGASTAAKPPIARQPGGAVTNTSLKQPVSTAKPSPAKPAATKSSSTSNSANNQ